MPTKDQDLITNFSEAVANGNLVTLTAEPRSSTQPLNASTALWSPPPFEYTRVCVDVCICVFQQLGNHRRLTSPLD